MDKKKKEKKKCLCVDINRDEVCIFRALICIWPCVRGSVLGEASDGGGRCDNATTVIIQHQLERCGASVASTYHIITLECRAADWSTAKPLPYESRAHLPPVTFYHRFLFFFSFFTSPMFFLLHSPAHLLPPFVPLPHSLRANLPIFKGSRTGPADGPSSAVSAVAVAVSVLHVVQSRCPVASFSFAPLLIVSR